MDDNTLPPDGGYDIRPVDHDPFTAAPTTPVALPPIEVRPDEAQAPAATGQSDEDIARAQIDHESAPRQGGLMQTVPELYHSLSTPEGRAKVYGNVSGAVEALTPYVNPGAFVGRTLASGEAFTPEGRQALLDRLAKAPKAVLSGAESQVGALDKAAKGELSPEQEADLGIGLGMQVVFGGPGAAREGAAGVSGGMLRQPTFEEHPARVEQRLPRAKELLAGDEGPQKNVDIDSMRLTPKLYENNVGLVRNYPGVKVPPRASTNTAADSFVNHVSDNLLWLYDQVPDDIKFRSAQWYDGGNKIVKDWAQQYGVPESTVAGVIAATSPQKDWFNNISIAKRILDQSRGDPKFYETQKMTPEMERFFNETPSLNKPEYRPLLDEIRDKSLADIDRIMPYPKYERDIYKALWMRLYDQAHTNPTYPSITPEGNFGPKVTTKYSGAPTQVAWGSLPEIAKAANIVDANGDQNVLANTIGMRHKVRNFYNNLINPNSAAGDVTVDTHAVAAGLLRPVSANSTEVAHNFGNWPGKDLPAAKNSAKTGIFGTYPLYADAYRKAAEQLGILPRQLQSVTWEAVRGLFPEDWKSAKNSAIIDNIWRQYRAGKETLDGTRQRILDTTGGIQPPSWYRPARANNAAAQNPGNAPDVFEPRVYGPGSQPTFAGTGRGTAGGASAPVVKPSPRDLAYEFDFGAGAPYNEQFPEWANLSGDQKATISKAMLDKIADHAKEVTGANEYARLSGLGSWHEFTNPSYKSRLVATPEVAGDFADTMGYLAQQTKIMGYKPDPAGDRLGLALYGDGLGDEKKLAAFWKDVNEKHPDFSSGFSPSRNQRGQPGIEMLFDESGAGMDARVANELIPALQRIADDHALGKIDSKTFRATEESREHDWTKDPTGGDYTSRLSARHGPDLLQRLELFKRQELEPALRQQIDAAQGASPGRGGDRGAGVQETQGAPSLPFRAAASPVKLGSGITDERTAAVRAAAAAAGGRPNLIGLPTENITLAGKPFVPGPVGAIHDIAEKYMADAGLPYDPPKTWVPVDKERASRVAKAFEDMKHAPDDPQVKASYDAMANETVAQFKALKDSGIKFEFIKPGMDDPYAENPRAAAQDVINNKHLWVFPTEGGFGSGSESAEAAMKNNPLLRPSGEKIEGKEVPVNDLFRIVHDVFGHLKDGNGFRASGEENAWRSHSAMYSDAARPAMTSETRGQNPWVNYGPHGDFNRTASGADTKYADQKIGLLPQWAIDEGRGDTHDFQKVDHDPFNNVIYHGTSKDKDFKTFKDARNGTWFTTNPKDASQYAVENDSMNFKYDPSSGKMVRTNTASRVIPVRHSFENTLDIDKWPDSVKHATNYKKALGDYFDTLRAQGYDSVRQREQNGHSTVVSLDNSKIRPAYQRADGGAVDYDPQQLGILGTSLQGPMAMTAIMGAHADWDKFDRTARPSTNIEDDRNRQKTFKEKYNNAIDDATDDLTGVLFRAHGGRVEPKNINHAPTEAQKEAGNYPKDKINILGLRISIENARGHFRRGVDKDGKEWKVRMPHHYGYILGTTARDNDHVDCYVGPHLKSPHVFVIDQVDAETGKYDEPKCMLAFGSENQAVSAYKHGFSDGKGGDRIGKITGMSVSQFRDWLDNGNTKAPFRHGKSRSERVTEILKRHGIERADNPSI